MEKPEIIQPDAEIVEIIKTIVKTNQIIAETLSRPMIFIPREGGKA